MAHDPFYKGGTDRKEEFSGLLERELKVEAGSRFARTDRRLEQFQEEMRQRYFEAKFRFYCSKALRKYDKILTKEQSLDEYYEENDPD